MSSSKAVLSSAMASEAKSCALVRAPGRHTGGVRVAAVSAAANSPLVSQRSSSSLGAHFGSSFVGALNEPSRVLPQLFCEIVRHIAHLRSEAEFLSVSVWCLLLGVVRSRGILGLDTVAEQQQAPGLGLLLPRAALHHSSPARNKVQVRTPQVRPWRQRAHTFY